MSNTERVTGIISIVKEYSAVQAMLVAATLVAFPALARGKHVVFLERTGEVRADDEDWRFIRHGAGVRYTGSQSGRVVDPHEAMLDHPDAFDPWRLKQYFDSLSISEVWFENERYPVIEGEGIVSLMGAMAARGAITCVSSAYSLYVVSEAYREAHNER